MIVLHIINVRWYNATAWYGATLANAGIKFGDKHIISSTPNAPVLDVADIYGIDNFSLDYNSNNPLVIIKTIFQFIGKVKKIKPDFIVAHRGEFFIFLAMIKLFSPFAKWKLIRVRGDARPPTSDIISRFTHNFIASAIVVPTKIIYNYFIDNLKSRQDHVHIIYGGVDRTVFRKDSDIREKIRNELEYTYADYVICMIARLDPVKGHDVFLKACGKIFKAGNIEGLKILIVGKPENISFDMLGKMVEENGLTTITKIAGLRNDIADIINAIDLGVIASQASETIARVAFEILATDKELIASDIGVLPEIITPDNIFKHDDADELVKKILHHKKEKRKYYSDDFYDEFRDILTRL